MNCQECQDRKGLVRCRDCEVILCKECDILMHTRTSKNFHERVILCEECETKESELFCTNCEESICESCDSKIHNKRARMKHIREKQGPLAKTKSIIEAPPGLKLQGERNEQELFPLKSIDGSSPCTKLPTLVTTHSAPKIQQVSNQQLLSSFQIEQSKQGQFYTPQKYPQQHQKPLYNPSPYNNYYPQIPLQFHQSSSHQQPLPPPPYSHKPTYYKDNYYNRIRTPREHANSLDLPLFPVGQFQPFIQKGGEKFIALQKVLREFARNGDIMISNNQIIEAAKTVIHTKNDKVVEEFLQKAEDLDIIHTTKRQFGNVKTLCFQSMKLATISLESLMWVLKSLKKDEMTPNERAIQNRIKEAFALKISGLQWERVLEALHTKMQSSQKLTPRTTTRKYSTTTPKTEEPKSQKKEPSSPEVCKRKEEAKSGKAEESTPETSGSLSEKEESKSKTNESERKRSSQPSSSVSETRLPVHTYSTSDPSGRQEAQEGCGCVIDFEMREMVDSSTGAKTHLIFPLADSWEGVDQKTSDAQPPLYDEFKAFMNLYFTTDPNKFWSQLDKSTVQNTHGQTQSLTHTQSHSQKKGSYAWASSVENALTRADSSKGLNPSNSGKHLDEEPDDENRAIPGGRYGCAQFLKTCGPPVLQNSSLGALSHLFQFAINEEILKYQRTLLVWRETLQKKKAGSQGEDGAEKKKYQSEVIQYKLNTVKNALIEVLCENKNGISLAQLPQYLKRKFSFTLDLNELGYGKLKDLILSMQDQIKLEIRGHNHPFAILKRNVGHNCSNSEDFSNRFQDMLRLKQQKTFSDDFKIHNFQQRQQQNIVEFNKLLELVRYGIYTLLHEFPHGIESTKIAFLLGTKVGINFDPQQFGCSSILEFLRKYILPTIDLEIIRINTFDPDSFIMRNKEILKQYNAKLAQQIQGSNANFTPMHFRFETDPQISNLTRNASGNIIQGQNLNNPPHSIDITNYYSDTLKERQKSQNLSSTTPVQNHSLNTSSSQPHIPYHTNSPNPMMYTFSPVNFYGSQNQNDSSMHRRSRSRSHSPKHSRTISYWNLSNKSSQDFTGLFPSHPALSSTLNISPSTYNSHNRASSATQQSNLHSHTLQQPQTQAQTQTQTQTHMHHPPVQSHTLQSHSLSKSNSHSHPIPPPYKYPSSQNNTQDHDQFIQQLLMEVHHNDQFHNQHHVVPQEFRRVSGFSYNSNRPSSTTSSSSSSAPKRVPNNPNSNSANLNSGGGSASVGGQKLPFPRKGGNPGPIGAPVPATHFKAYSDDFTQLNKGLGKNIWHYSPKQSIFYNQPPAKSPEEMDVVIESLHYEADEHNA